MQIERRYGFLMSGVRYAFSDPCGMEMIIMVIIQRLNTRFLYGMLGSRSTQGPDVGVCMPLQT